MKLGQIRINGLVFAIALAVAYLAVPSRTLAQEPFFQNSLAFTGPSGEAYQISTFHGDDIVIPDPTYVVVQDQDQMIVAQSPVGSIAAIRCSEDRCYAYLFAYMGFVPSVWEFDPEGSRPIFSMGDNTVEAFEALIASDSIVGFRRKLSPWEHIRAVPNLLSQRPDLFLFLLVEFLAFWFIWACIGLLRRRTDLGGLARGIITATIILAGIFLFAVVLMTTFLGLPSPLMTATALVATLAIPLIRRALRQIRPADPSSPS